MVDSTAVPQDLLMSTDQVAAFAATGESETLEFKETTDTRREAARTVCTSQPQS